MVAVSEEPVRLRLRAPFFCIVLGLPCAPCRGGPSLQTGHASRKALPLELCHADLIEIGRLQLRQVVWQGGAKRDERVVVLLQLVLNKQSAQRIISCLGRWGNSTECSGYVWRRR